MTWGDVAQIAIALIALGVALYSIRRDRAILRARFVSAAAGTWTISVVNVGLRSVRVERMVRRTWFPWGERDVTAAIAAVIGKPLGPSGWGIVLAPADETTIAVGNEANYHGRRYLPARWYLVDAGGGHHRIQ